jgi:hypothetical protein
MSRLVYRRMKFGMIRARGTVRARKKEENGAWIYNLFYSTIH